ncbi:MAG: PilZ domain-containing protein [Acidobacteria bacterium]|nr:PilZ domain-containing protein [Acidobacteriota bacterium]
MGPSTTHVDPVRSGRPDPAERRRSRRLKIAQQVRVRPSGFVENEFEEVLTTVNISRDGVYFVTERKDYIAGLRLFVTTPYSTAPGALNMEYLARVVRVDSLSGGRRGIAIHLLTPIKFKS